MRDQKTLPRPIVGSFSGEVESGEAEDGPKTVIPNRYSMSSRVANSVRREAQAGGDVEAGGGTGDAEALSAFFARVPEGDRTFFKEDVLHGLSKLAA